MIRLLVLITLAATLLATTGCKTNKGSREFIPGRGWVPTRWAREAAERLLLSVRLGRLRVTTQAQWQQ